MIPITSSIAEGIDVLFVSNTITSQNCYLPRVCALCHPPGDALTWNYICFNPRVTGDLCQNIDLCPDCKGTLAPNPTPKTSESVDDSFQIADYSSNDEAIQNNFQLAPNDDRISSDFQGLPNTPTIPNDFRVSSNDLPILGEKLITSNDFVSDQSDPIWNDGTNVAAKP